MTQETLYTGKALRSIQEALQSIQETHCLIQWPSGRHGRPYSTETGDVQTDTGYALGRSEKTPCPFQEALWWI